MQGLWHKGKHKHLQFNYEREISTLNSTSNWSVTNWPISLIKNPKIFYWCSGSDDGFVRTKCDLQHYGITLLLLSHLFKLGYCNNLKLFKEGQRDNISYSIHERWDHAIIRPFFPQQIYVSTVWLNARHCHCVYGCAPCRTESSTQADIHLTDIRGDSSTVAYGNRLLTAKTWHQRKQVSQAWHSVFLRELRDRLSAYSEIITPITGTLIPDKGEGSK